MVVIPDGTVDNAAQGVCFGIFERLFEERYSLLGLFQHVCGYRCLLQPEFRIFGEPFQCDGRVLVDRIGPFEVGLHADNIVENLLLGNRVGYM